MSKQLTLSSLIAIVAMASLAILTTAQPVGTDTSSAAGSVQAKLPQVEEDALGLLLPQS